MKPGVAVALTACAGGLVAMQAPINSKLGKAVGTNDYSKAQSYLKGYTGYTS